MPTVVSRTATFLLVILLLATAGCNPCERFETESPPWRHTGGEAPYEVVLPADWVAQPPHTVNAHADLVAMRNEAMYFMVIPQELPSFPPPDVFELKERALEMLDESVDELVIERRSSLEIDGVSGLTVFARGTIDQQPVHYITVYVIDGEYGYQIIAFSDEQQRSQLFEQMDTILSTWQFSSATDNGESGAATETESTDSPGSPQESGDDVTDDQSP